MNKTGIEWTDATWNPIRGCSRVSEGCRNCYAEKVAYRFSGPGLAYEGLVQVAVDQKRPIFDTYKNIPKWNGQIKFVEEHLLDPLKWRTPKRIFVNSMSDLFHENVTDEMLDRIFAVMATATHQTFQILTKRPERMLQYLSYADLKVRLQFAIDEMIPGGRRLPKGLHAATDGTVVPHTSWPLPNVWLGVSVENQKAADERLDYLCEIASRGWQTMVSFEPLLGNVDPGAWWLSLGGKTWAIVGGESGPGARPMHPDWARSLRDQCVAAGVPFFFKQWGEFAEWATLPGIPPPVESDIWLSSAGIVRGNVLVAGDSCLRRVGKKAAGRLLDGREWNEFPLTSRAIATAEPELAEVAAR